MRLAVHETIRAHWTDRIHEEWMRNVHADYEDVSWEDLSRIRQLMEKALPGASVEEYEHHIEELTLPDPSDRHVLAAAIKAEASHIVTFNTKDFPKKALKPHGIEVTGPDAFAFELVDRSLGKVLQVASAHRASLSRPPKSPEEYLRLLEKSGLEETTIRLSRHLDKL
mgnify:CR=1 FL=1